MSKTALVDIDGVLADWMGGLRTKLHEICQASNKGYPLDGDQKSWELLTGDPDADDLIATAQNHPELYISLPVIDGAKQGLETLERLGYNVFICSTPAEDNPTCASQKLAWIKDNFGVRWVPKVILTSDKTLVRGDILIDDKPIIKGAMEPEWEHIIFDASYNKQAKGRRLAHWSELESVLRPKNLRWDHDDTVGWRIAAMTS